ncbi:hypothetical protein NXY56_000744 [Leishmania guyanensis]
MPFGGCSNGPMRATTATTMSVALPWGDSRDDRGTAAAAKSPSAFSANAELAQLASSASSWSSMTAANNTRDVINAYKGPGTPSGPSTPAGVMTRSGEGKGTPSQQSTTVSEDFSIQPEWLNGGAGDAAFKYTAAPLAVQLPHSTTPTPLRDNDDYALDIIKESIKHQLASIEEEKCVSENTYGNLAAALRQTLQPQPQPQQHRYLSVPLQRGATSEATGACRTGGDGHMIHIPSAAVPPAPRSAAPSRPRETRAMRCTSSPVSAVGQLAATSIGQSSESRANASFTSGSGTVASGVRSKSPPQPQLPQAPSQQTAELSAEQPFKQPQPQPHSTAATVYPLNSAASRATLFEQQRQPSANDAGGMAGNVSTRGEMNIHPGSLRIPLSTSSARLMGDSRGAGEVTAVSASAEAAPRTSSHTDPSCDTSSDAATARTLTVPTTASSSSISTVLQSSCLSSERSSFKDELTSAGHHYHVHSYRQYPNQPRPGLPVAELSHGRHPHPPEIPALQVESLQGECAAPRQQERLQRKETQQQEQLQRVRASSLMSFQGGPRFPNLPPHLQPQQLPQTQRQSHPQQLLSHPQSQQLQQQQLGVPKSPSAAMMPGKIYAATPQGRLILLTPDGVRTPQVQPPQHSLPPPLPPPPLSTATSSALTGNYVTASNYSALFCRNNPLHSMRYPGSESEGAGRPACGAGRLKDEKGTAATSSSTSEGPSTQVSNATVNSVASEKYVSRSLTVGQSCDDAAANHSETRVTVTPAVVTTGNASAKAPALPTGRLGAATGASVATGSAGGVESSSSSVTASASCESRPPTSCAAPLLVHNAYSSTHGVSIGERAQHLSSHPSSNSSVNGVSGPLQLQAFLPREDISTTSPTGGAYHPNPSPGAMSALPSNGATMSPLSKVQPLRVNPDLNLGRCMANSLALSSTSPSKGSSNAQVLMPGSGYRNRRASSDTVVTGSQSVAAVGLMGSNNNTLGNLSIFGQLPTALKPLNGGLGMDITGAGDSDHAAHFTHSISPPVFSASASPSSYSPPAALGSTNGNGGAVGILTQAPLQPEPASSHWSASRTDLFSQTTKSTWSGTISSPLTPGSMAPPPPQSCMHGSSPPSAQHSTAGGRLHATADDSVVVTVPIANTDGTVTAAVITVPPPFSYTDVGLQQYCLGALQQQPPQQQRPCPPLQQQHLYHRISPAEEQRTTICAGEEEEWRLQQELITLQLEQHRQRLENELRQVQFQQAQQQQQQQQLQHAQHQHQQQQLQSSPQQHQRSPLPVQAAMVAIDGRLYRMMPASSGEAFVKSGEPCRDLHSLDRDSLVSDGAAAADVRTEAPSFHLQNHPGVPMAVSPQAQLSLQQPQPQQHMFTMVSDRSALREVTAAASSLAKPPTPGANVLLVMPAPSAPHTMQYGY